MPSVLLSLLAPQLPFFPILQMTQDVPYIYKLTPGDEALIEPNAKTTCVP